jgi:enamine deaminase RidA (YjgF/YER057c/UK114 family)
MAVKAFTSEELAEPHGYAHAVSATGSRTVYTSGALGVDAEGGIVGEGTDYRAQGYQATLNVHSALRAAGAAPADVVKFTMFVVDPTEENLGQLYRGIGRASKELGGSPTGTTLVGVAALAVPGAVYEVDAIAVLED